MFSAPFNVSAFFLIPYTLYNFIIKRCVADLKKTKAYFDTYIIDTCTLIYTYLLTFL